MRILVFRGGAIGDFILTLPVFHALRQVWPRAELTLAGYPRIAELARVAGLVDRVLDINAARFSAYFVPEPLLPLQESDFIRSFDLVISYLHDPDGALRSNLIQSGARRVICVSPQVASGHAVDHFLSALEPLGLPDLCASKEQDLPFAVTRCFSTRSGRTCSNPKTGRAQQAVPLRRHDTNTTSYFPAGGGAPSPILLDISPDLQAAGRTKLNSLGLKGPVIAIHPGSGSVKKNWPLLSFLALAGKIQQARLGRVLWIVGEADEAIAHALIVEFPPHCGVGFSCHRKIRQGGNRAETSVMDAVGRHTCLRQGYGGQGMAAQAPASRVTLDKSYAGLQKKCDQSKKLLQEWSGLTGNTPILKDCSLLEVASVLSQCRGYAGNDSGISHLAAAVGIPTVALFGPTDPEVWGPRGTKVSILRGRPPTTKGLARIPEDDVFQRLQILMKSDRRPESAATGGNCGDLRSP